MAKSKSSNITFLVIMLSFALLAVAVPSYILYQELQDPEKLKAKVLNYVNNKLNGDLIVDNLSLSLESGVITLQADTVEVFLKKKEANVSKNEFLARAKNLVLRLPWDVVLTGLRSLQHISFSALELKLIQDETGKWNFQKLIRGGGRKSFRIDRLDLEQLDLAIYTPKQELHYNDVALKWLKDSSNIYSLDLETLESEKNYIKLLGSVDVGPINRARKSQSTLDFELRDFELNSFLDLNSKFDVLEQRLLDLDLLEEAILNIKGTLGKASRGKNIDLDAAIDWNSASAIGDFLINVKAAVTKRHLQFENLDFHLYEQGLDQKAKTEGRESLNAQVKGRLANWQDSDPGMDLKFISKKFKFQNLLQKLPRESSLRVWYDSWLRSRALFADGSIALDLDLSGPSSKPSVNGYINLEQFYLANIKRRKNQNILNYVSQGIKAKLVLDAKNLTIEEFKIPIKHSSTSLTGWLARNQESFNLQLSSAEMPLSFLNELPLDSWLAIKGRLPRLSGYTNFQMGFSKASLDEPMQFKGESKFGKVVLFAPEYSLLLKNLYGHITFDNDLLDIKNLYGYLAEDYFESRGIISNFSDSLAAAKLDLKFASKKINIQNILDPKLLSFISSNFIKIPFIPTDSSGHLLDLWLGIKTVSKNKYQYSGRFTLDDVAYQVVKQGSRLSNLNGHIEFTNSKWQFEKLAFRFNQDANFFVDGSIEENVPKLNIKTEKLRIRDVAKLLNSNFDHYALLRLLKDSEAEGLLNLDLTFNAKDIAGEVSLENVSLSPLRTLLPVTKLNGKAKIDSNAIQLDSITGFYGHTKFDITGEVDDYYPDKDSLNAARWDLDFKTILDVTELSNYFPEKLAKFVHARGTMPLDLSLEGDKTKNFLKLTADLGSLDQFGFSTWLNLDQSFATKLESSLTITPKAIITENCQLYISDGRGQIDSLTRLKTFFQIKDWSHVDDISYYVRVKSVKKTPYLKNIDPHITALDPFKFDFTTGKFECNTFGNMRGSQTICDIKAKEAIARNYGIGDLRMKGNQVDLFAVTDEPVQTHFATEEGDWHGIPYKNLSFDLTVTQDQAKTTDLKANVKEGEIWADYNLNLKTLKSNFIIGGHDLPAHEIAEGIWGLGNEVPAGLVDGSFAGSTESMDPDTMFYKLVARANLVVKHGKLSQLKSMQKLLTAINTFKEGFFNFDLNNVMQTVITFNGGKFNYLISSLNYNLGKVSTEKLLLKSDQTELEIKGYLDYAQDHMDVVGQGLIPRKSESILSKIGVGAVNLGNAVSVVSPSLAREKDELRFFDFKMKGSIEKDTNQSVQYLRDTFSWREYD